MEISEEILTDKVCLEDKKVEFMSYLKNLGYRESTLRYYGYVMNYIKQYMLDKHVTEYTEKIGSDFLREQNIKKAHKPVILERQKLAVRRFNSYIFRNEYISMSTVVASPCPTQFSDIYNEYLRSLKLRGLRANTIRNYSRILMGALKVFDIVDIKHLQDLKASDIYTAFEHSTDKCNFSVPMRCFLRYLHEIKCTESDMSPCVPTKRKHKPVPSVFTKTEVEKFLSSFDLETIMGKRDYAIVLLALRLGLRAGDIAHLKIEDIDFCSKTISITQEKTHVKQRLELLPEIETAINSYLADSKRESSSTNIFQTMLNPIRPISRQLIRTITGRYLTTSGIEIGNRKKGPHALRMTLASELVSEGVPYDAVRKILGHEDPSAMKHYVKFDLEELRTCAIEVPPITGKLSDFVYAERGDSR